MARILALVEGPTERNFGQKVLAPHLYSSFQLEFHPRVIGIPGHKGGVGPWDRAKKEIIKLIRQEPTSVVTTMFDLYGLPKSWPGREDALDTGLKNDAAVAFIEKNIADAIRLEFKASEPRFVAYLSQHEYEAMLFSNPVILAGVTLGADHADGFQAILDDCGECEKINDNPLTAPSKRLLKIATSYQKTVIAAERIGLPTIRQKCPHFNAWLSKLESFGKS
jgi:hypothetical protein